MNDQRVRQFVTASGDEIVCEVIEWDSNDDPALVVRNILQIVSVESRSGRYHMLRPYMSFQIDDSMYQTINVDHISITALPSVEILEQYKTAVSNESMTEEELNAKIEEYIERMKEVIDDADDLKDEDGNIIKFPSKDKLH